MSAANDEFLQENEPQVNLVKLTLAVAKVLETQRLAKHGPIAPTMVMPQVSDNFTAQVTHPNQINPFVTPDSPGTWCTKDDVPPQGIPSTAAFAPKRNEWHMKCIACPNKVEIQFSHDVFMTDLLLKGPYGKNHPRYPNGASTTACPLCQSMLPGESHASGCSTNAANGYLFHHSCLGFPQFVTSYGESVPLIESDCKVLHLKLSDAMAMVQSKDRNMSVKIFCPHDIYATADCWSFG